MSLHGNITENMANKQEVDEQTTIDKLNSNLGSASEKIAENKNVILWVVVAIVVAAALVMCYLFLYRNPQVNKAYEAYNDVEIKAMGNDSIATAEYKKVADKFSGTGAGDLAALSAGQALYEQGKYQEAVKYLEDGMTGEPVLDANTLALVGDCYVNLKKYDKALEYFDKAIKKADKNPQICPRVLIKEANVYDEQKKYDKALSCYEQIRDNYPEFQPGNGATVEAYIAREEARLGK